MSIKDYLELMMEEIEGAICYKNKAIEYPMFKDTYIQMAVAEMNHYKNLETMMMEGLNEEERELWNNEIVKIMYSIYEEKYNNLKKELENV